MNSLGQKKNLLRKQVSSLNWNVEVSLNPIVEDKTFPKGLWAMFKPLGEEPGLKDLPADVEFCWPYTLDSALGEMTFSKATRFKKSELGFLEPDVCNEILKKNISVIFVPGKTFDFKGNRLGRGKGFYDRYLKDFNGVTVGVCSRARFLMEPIPVEQNLDVAVEYILTEQFLYKVNPSGKVV